MISSYDTIEAKSLVINTSTLGYLWQKPIVEVGVAIKRGRELIFKKCANRKRNLLHSR